MPHISAGTWNCVENDLNLLNITTGSYVVIVETNISCAVVLGFL